MRKQDQGWTAPAPAPFSSDRFLDGNPVFSSDGRTLSFTTNRPFEKKGLPRSLELWVWKDGVCADPERLSDSVNSASYEGYPSVAPDESYLIFESDRPGGLGGTDLYISVRRPDGAWTMAVNLGPRVRSTASKRFPTVTPNGEYFFFGSNRSGSFDYDWIDVSVIKDLSSVPRRQSR